MTSRRVNYPTDLREPANVASILRNFESLRLLARQFTGRLYFKDPQTTAHYWRLTANASGALVTTDAGTERPTDFVLIVE